MNLNDLAPTPTVEQVRESLAAAEEYLRGASTSRATLDAFAWIYTEEAVAFAREHIAWAKDFLAQETDHEKTQSS